MRPEERLSQINQSEILEPQDIADSKNQQGGNFSIINQPENTLDSTKHEELSINFDSYFSLIFNKIYDPNSSLEVEEVDALGADDISQLANSSPELFIDRLITFIDTKSCDHSRDSTEKIHIFLDEIERGGISIEDLFGKCSVNQLIILGAKMSEVTEARNRFGGVLVDDITYDLSLYRDDWPSAFRRDKYIDGFYQDVQNLSLAEKLNLSNFLETLAADAIASGSWSLPARNIVENIIEKMREESQSVFLDNTLDLAERRIESEMEYPTLSVIKNVSKGDHGKLSERLDNALIEESDRIAHSIKSSVPLQTYDGYLRVSRDAIAIIDRTNSPRLYGRIKEEDVKERSEVDVRSVERVRSAVEDIEGFRIYFAKIFNYINELIMHPAFNTDINSAEDLGEVWREKIGIFSKEQWEDFFKARIAVDTMTDDLCNFEIQQWDEAGDKNEILSNELIIKIYDKLTELITGGMEEPQEWKHLEQLVKNNKLSDETFDVVDTILMPYHVYRSIRSGFGSKLEDVVYAKESNPVDDDLKRRMFKNYHPDLDALSKEWDDLPRLHRANNDAARLALEERYNQEEERRLQYVGEYILAESSVKEKILEIQHGILDFIGSFENEINTDLPKVDFVPYRYIDEDKNINPYSNQNNSDLPTLLRQLHRPLMREKIESDLDISFNDFNLNSQVHLLQFLAGNNKEIYGQIKDLLHKDIPYKNEFLISFLSCAGDYSFGNVLLAIAEKFSPEIAEKIFVKYSELANQADGVGDYLRSDFGEQLKKKPGLGEEITSSLLKKGKEILETASKMAGQEDSILSILNDTHADLQFFANAFKSLKKEGVDVKLDQFPGTSIEDIRAKELDEATKEQLLAISDQNWRLRPHMYEAIMESFKKSLEDPQTIFHIVKNGDKVVAFFRMDDTAPQERYFGSVNIRPETQGYALAPALMQQMFLREADGFLVTAHCNPWDKVTEQYIGDSGFVATKLLDYSGQPAFEIERDGREREVSESNQGVSSSENADSSEENPPTYQYQKLSYAELLSLQVQNPDNIRIYKFSQDAAVAPDETENARFMKDVNELTAQGMVVTNFRYGPPESDGRRPLLVAYEGKL